MEVIDAAWIRSRLTHRHGELKELADHVGISADKITKILKGERQVRAHEMPRIIAYFSENRSHGLSEPARPYAAAPVPMAPSARDEAIGAAICPDTKHRAFYRCRSAIPGAALLADDRLIVSLGDRPAAGDLVIVTLSDPQTDTQTTEIRRYWPPLLVPLDLNAGTAVTEDDGQSVAILAVIRASFRASTT